MKRSIDIPFAKRNRIAFRGALFPLSIIGALCIHAIILTAIILPYYLSDPYTRGVTKKDALTIIPFRQVTLLLASEDVLPEENPASFFASDKDTASYIRETDVKGYNVRFPNSTELPSVSDVISQPTPNVSRETQTPRESDNSLLSITESDFVLDAPQEQTVPEYSRIPTSYDENKEFALNLDTGGQAFIGTRLEPYAEYFRHIVETIRPSWYRMIPPRYTFAAGTPIQLVSKDDSIVVRVAITHEGRIRFDGFLSRSQSGQESLEAACRNGVEFAGDVPPPPFALLDEYGVDNAFYFPLRFDYRW